MHKNRLQPIKKLPKPMRRCTKSLQQARRTKQRAVKKVQSIMRL